MKQIVILLVFPLLLVATGFTKPKSAEIIIKTTFYCNHYDQCESKPALEKEIMLTAGVKAVTIDASAMTIKVKYNPSQVSPEKIRTVISKAGYDADDVKADPKGSGKLDGCCQKKE
jgi:copper chaperone CopZ